MNVFITVGTQKFPFDRMIKMADQLFYDNPSVIIYGQIGTANYKPKCFEYVEYLESEEFERKIIWSDIVITHGGVGTIIKALNNYKKVIVVPRLSKYNEHVDDHQVQIASSFEEMNYLVASKEQDTFNELIQKCTERSFAVYKSNRENILNIIEQFINEVHKDRFK